MAWKQLDLQNATINMSKVVPFDSALSMLDKKQAYYHNNRLTALKKYTTDYAVGYKCYKRQASADNLVDGELTDYIEINKVTESGSVVHMLDVADTYYKAEEITGMSDAETALEGTHLILNGIDVGLREDYVGYIFIDLPDKCFLVQTTDNTVEVWTYTTNYNNKVTIANATSFSDVMLVQDKRDSEHNILFIFNQSQYDQMVTDRDYICNNRVSGGGTLSTSSEVYLLKDGTFDLSVIGQSNFHAGSILGPESNSSASLFTVAGRASMSQTFHQTSSESSITIYGIEHMSLSVSPFDGTETESDSDSYYAGSGYGSAAFVTASDSFLGLSVEISELDNGSGFKAGTATQGSVNCIFKASSRISLNITKDSTPTVYTLSADSFQFKENQNDTRILANGFVLNYLNKQPVSLGHNFKIVVRFDTSDSKYKGYDDSYIYVGQRGKTYRISLAKMFDSTEYDNQVNIIESEYCNTVGGYKIFNTTTYYNAIYDDDSSKVICSCDDWNSRITITCSNMSATKKATSRVGHFWNATASYDDIPCIAISDEQNDFDVYDNSSYTIEFANSEYTIHPGTKAYLYFPDSVTSDTMVQQYEIASTGITYSRAELVYTHNDNYQLVPSILFCDFLKSDVVNIIQIGSEAYELLNYAYSTATPALVYQEEAISINVDPSSQEMVIQGAYYTISGASSARRILNPYDTSSSTYCCDVTGLRYLGYDSEQGYFYSPATGVIYTFNGANKLNAFLEVDKRIPLESGVVGDESVGIEVTNIPSMNIIAMAFTDGVLIICNGQSLFIECQSVNEMEASKEYGLIRINGSYYYFGTNNTITGLVEDTKEVTVDFNLKSAKIGFNRLSNQTCQKHRLVIYADSLNSSTSAEVTVTLTGVLGNKNFTETFTKTITANDLLNNEYQWEFNPKNTKSMYFQTEVNMTNADLLEYWMDINETAEENLVRR